MMIDNTDFERSKVEREKAQEMLREVKEYERTRCIVRN